MFDLFVALADLLLQVLLEFAGEAIIDLGLRALVEVLGTPEFDSPFVAAIGYMALGASTGGLSVLMFPHPLIHPSRIHGISLLVSPIVTGSIMSLIGSMLRRRGKKVVRIESFWFGFAVAFGMALMRLLLVR